MEQATGLYELALEVRSFTRISVFFSEKEKINKHVFPSELVYMFFSSDPLEEETSCCADVSDVTASAMDRRRRIGLPSNICTALLAFMKNEHRSNVPVWAAPYFSELLTRGARHIARNTTTSMKSCFGTRPTLLFAIAGPTTNAFLTGTYCSCSPEELNRSEHVEPKGATPIAG